MKRILILSDTHCGHRYGLAHPDQCVNKFQKEAWKFFETGIKRHGPYNNIFMNGDAIDGRAKKNAGVELITTNLEEQADMFIKILRSVITMSKSSPKCMFTRGTPYHTGESEDWENIIAKEFRRGYQEGEKNIDEAMLVDVDGVIFDLKHKIGSSAMPNARVGAPARLIVQALLKENYQDRPKANVFVRSHVHYHTQIHLMGRTAMTTPALQINSSYGERQCEGIIDFGFVVVEVERGKVLRIIPHIAPNPIKQTIITKG